MKRLVRTFFVLGSVFLFFSCSIQSPIERKPASNNADYNVEYLFEHDGCKVYRFRDYGNNGEYIYFTNCNGNAISFTNDSTKTQITNTIQKSTE